MKNKQTTQEKDSEDENNLKLRVLTSYILDRFVGKKYYIPRDLIKDYKKAISLRVFL